MKFTITNPLSNTRLIALLCTSILCTQCIQDDPVSQEPSPTPCQEQLPKSYAEKKQHFTLVFVDITSSSIFGKKAKKRLDQTIQKRMVRPGDQTKLYLIEANTNWAQQSSSNFRVKLDSIPYILNATMRNRTKETRYACELKQQVDAGIEAITNAVSEQKGQLPNKEQKATDIFPLFRLAKDEFNQVPKGVVKTILVISDMEQNAATNFAFDYKNMFCTHNFSTDSVRQLAKADLSKMKRDYQIHRQFERVIWIEDKADKQASDSTDCAVEDVRIYWETIVTGLGCQKRME